MYSFGDSLSDKSDDSCGFELNNELEVISKMKLTKQYIRDTCGHHGTRSANKQSKDFNKFNQIRRRR